MVSFLKVCLDFVLNNLVFTCVFVAVVLSLNGTFSCFFHGHQICQGAKHPNTRFWCRLDVLFSAASIAALSFKHCVTWLHPFLLIIGYKLAVAYGPYYVICHCIWHAYAAIAVYLLVEGFVEDYSIWNLPWVS